MFETCVGALAPGGKLIVIGMMSAYKEGWLPGSYPGVCVWGGGVLTGSQAAGGGGAWAGCVQAARAACPRVPVAAGVSAPAPPCAPPPAGLCEKLLWKSASVHGFFLLRHQKQWQ